MIFLMVITLYTYFMTTPDVNPLRESIQIVGTSPTWQWLGATAHVAENRYTFDVCSRGPVPPIEEAVFDDLTTGRVEISTSPKDHGEIRVHVLTYFGDGEGLRRFTGHLTGELNSGEKGDPDIHKSPSGAFTVLDAVARRLRHS
jgi:hypothetical protein